MNIGQYDGIMGRLEQILAAIKDWEPPETETVRHGDGTETFRPASFTVHHMDGTKTVTPAVPEDGRRTALLAMLQVLDSWIEGARSNHGALGHPNDVECCETFHPSDIRNMINDAAREIGLPHRVHLDGRG